MRIFKLIVEILLLLNLSQPFVMAATCLIDPLTDPEASSPFGSYRRGQGRTVHQGLDLVPKKALRVNQHHCTQTQKAKSYLQIFVAVDMVFL